MRYLTLFSRKDRPRRLHVLDRCYHVKERISSLSKDRKLIPNSRYQSW